MGLRVCGLGLALGLTVPSMATAQLSPVGVPAGVVRFEADGALESWDSRYFDGHKENWGADVASPALGNDLFPFRKRTIGNDLFRGVHDFPSGLKRFAGEVLPLLL